MNYVSDHLPRLSFIMFLYTRLIVCDTPIGLHRGSSFLWPKYVLGHVSDVCGFLSFYWCIYFRWDHLATAVWVFLKCVWLSYPLVWSSNFSCLRQFRHLEVAHFRFECPNMILLLPQLHSKVSISRCQFGESYIPCCHRRRKIHKRVFHLAVFHIVVTDIDCRSWCLLELLSIKICFLKVCLEPHPRVFIGHNALPHVVHICVLLCC